MKRRHINEFLGTTFESHGNRAAGMGILHDRYDDEYNPAEIVRDNVMVRFPSRSKEEKAALNGPVITKKLVEVEEE
jgi:hypothetical protein